MKEKQRGVKVPMTPVRALLGVNGTEMHEKRSENFEGAKGDEGKSSVWPRKYKNHLTSREMESLVAISDTFVPSVEPPSHCAESVESFYRTSASMTGTPEIVGAFMSERLHHPMLWMLRVTLWFLSTWYGTFAICGVKSLSSDFPYFRSLPQIELKRREEIVRDWSTSYFYLLRELFRSMKYIIHLFFFTQINEQNENESWNAIGYCGPDPRIVDKKSSDHQLRADHLGPLHPALAYHSQVSFDALDPFQKPNPRTISCDVVVVGSGSGGGLVAGVLARAGYKVIVLEKGDYHANSTLSLLEGPSLDSMYEGGGLVATHNTNVLLLAGSTVGGGSAINWSASIRTPDHVISEWRNERGLELFGSEAYAEAMNVVCSRMGVQTGKVPSEYESLATTALRKGCRDLGYPVQDTPCNTPRNHDCGWCGFGCPDRLKKGTHETWLVDLVKSGNGMILTGCKAVRVVHEDRGRRRRVATGVLFQYEDRKDDEIFFVQSNMTVVACGAINTPVLLKKSGLRNSNIGKHLHLHPVVMVWGHFPSSTRKSYEGAILTAMSKVESNDGYGAMIQTPALHPGIFSTLTPWLCGNDFKERMSRFSHTAHLFTLVRDRGSGTISSSGYISYTMDPRDEEMSKKGIERMIRIMAAAGADEIGTHHCKGYRVKPKSASSHEFENFIKMVKEQGIGKLTTPVSSAHQMGSCRMGVSEKASVVDQRGESWEVEGLYLADGSVVPTAIGVNPMVTIQSIAYCIAQSVLEELRRKIPKQPEELV
ncbi:hypothetical protein LUZ60_016987 [Juncus effusus]|nr:hypothetical protein LUZ60_016987 [Juncus effusus]